MKFRFIATVVGFILIQNASAQTMKTVFSEMPDSLLPYLQKNRRLDCIDFIENRMKAEVENSFGEKSELVALTDSTLEMKLSETSVLRLRLLPSSQMILFEKVISVPERQSFAKLYTLDWKEIPFTETLYSDVKKYLTPSEVLKFTENF